MARGVKTCKNPACKADIAGARTKVCPACRFVQIEDIVYAEDSGLPISRDRWMLPPGYSVDRQPLLIFAPAGLCPIKFKENVDNFQEWADTLRREMLRLGKWLKPNAVFYWLRQCLNLDPGDVRFPAYAALAAELPDIIQDKVELPAPQEPSIYIDELDLDDDGESDDLDLL